jgi:hypothetical protein
VKIAKKELSTDAAKKIAIKSLCHQVATWDESVVPDIIFKKIITNVDPNLIPDRELLSNKRIVENIDWNSLSNIKAIRMMMRDKTLIERIDLNQYKFKLSELIPLFLHHEELVEYFDIDFSELTASEAINMLQINQGFVDKIELEKYKYNSSETIDLIRSFGANEKIMAKLDIESLDHFGVRTILKKTGDKYIRKIDSGKIKATDWLEILKSQPGLLEYCNLSLFEKGDRYLLVRLVQMFPQLSYLIKENKDKISAIGWEALLINNPEKYSEMCQYELLSRKNWDNIIKRQPLLKTTMKKYVIF